MKPLPLFISEMLAAPPKTGEGVHNWLFRVARQLHPHLPGPEIISLLKRQVQGCGRNVGHNEIANAVKDSLPCAWQPRPDGTPSPVPTKWPEINMKKREAILRDYGGLADLCELSKPRIEDDAAHADEIIDRLFPGNPLLCCGKSNSAFDTRPRDAWRGRMSQLALIVPSPMSAIEGITKAGRPSRHTLNNTGPRRFLICEFDTGTSDDQAALLTHLGCLAPLVCVVHSGGKSWHGWFYVHCHPEEKVKEFFCYAVSLGADRATWTRSQFVRMPDGTRDNGNRQRVYYINFKSLEPTK